MRLGLRAKLIVLAGIIFACVFTVLGVRELYRSATPVPQALAQPQPPAPRTLLAAATRPIKTGETITADMFRNASSNPAKHPGVATTAEVLGKVAARDIPDNALISRNALTPESKLSLRVPVGMRAISIATTDEIAVAGLIRPGDHVDVQVVYPGEDALSGARRDGRSHADTLLQKVQVLAVGDVVVGTQSETDAANGISSPPPPARTVTLALAPSQISTLSLAKNTGALYLALRNPEDDGLANVPQLATAPSVRHAPVSARRTSSRTRSKPASPKPAPHGIELVVGGREKTIYSGGATR